MKKYVLIFMSTIFLLSCSSEYNPKQEDNKNKTNVEIGSVKDLVTETKKQQILEKFKVLGLDPERVRFTDEYLGEEKIIVKSINDIEIVFKDLKDIISLNDEEGRITDFVERNPVIKTELSFDNSTRDNGSVDYFQIYNSTKVMGSIYMDMNYSFSYSPTNLRHRIRDGIIDVSSFITGLVIGVSYYQQYVENELHMYRSSMSELHELRIHGIMNYNLFVEDIGTVYTSPVLTVIKFRLPSSKYATYPSFIQAFSRVL